jgi:two-component system phosphate regulon sensor histidine kinase PhoR
MNQHVESILQAAVMDKQEIKLSKEPVPIHAMIYDIIDHYRLQLDAKQATLSIECNATQDVLEVDPVHFRNMLSNLVDNAIKYSNDALHLSISTSNTNRSMQIRVADNGIGMTKETVKRIFEKFYRAHTGNIHNVKGFGLGLSYVKAMVDAHGGTIKAESALGKGTTFQLEFPM